MIHPIILLPVRKLQVFSIFPFFILVVCLLLNFTAKYLNGISFGLILYFLDHQWDHIFKQQLIIFDIFLKGLIKTLANFSILLCIFLVLICRSSLYILTMNPLSDITNVFSHYVIRSFSLSVTPSVKQNFFFYFYVASCNSNLLQS